ncbi:hypothetical protein AKJ39_03765 [candidate division MSBL1 archaeon SCGC-AAA259J03]|uniref:Hydantoinase n=1 Tax=candidate division MSBL1 archaeon SCGC-AAA259J03 TaxID=1698269 RepID=A0A656YVF8_9EURY|nr:hypothetical protein AKJ39_03765 [candidate division MSBL1 archaeon SCGC-AAA259J03]
MEKIGVQDVENLAAGAAVLGTGGGGDPRVGKLMAEQAIEKHGPIEVIQPRDVPDDSFVIPTAMMGAPMVSTEKLPKGDEALKSFRALENYLGGEGFATMSIEIGGLNSTIPLAVAASLEMPIVDADGMGRAFPEIQMVTPTLGGISATPMAMGDEKGNAVFLETVDNFWTEKFSRSVTSDMGGSAIIALYAMNGEEIRDHTIHGSLTRVSRIGQAVMESKSPLEDLLEVTGGYHLFRGKVVDVNREITGGFVEGKAFLEGIEGFEGRLEIEFQNENLIARKDGEVMATTPDLICVVDSDTAEPITTEGIKYGYRVDVLGVPCNDKWRSKEAIDLVGPGYFGYDVEYEPIERRFE